MDLRKIREHMNVLVPYVENIIKLHETLRDAFAEQYNRHPFMKDVYDALLMKYIMEEIDEKFKKGGED